MDATLTAMETTTVTDGIPRIAFHSTSGRSAGHPRSGGVVDGLTRSSCRSQSARSRAMIYGLIATRSRRLLSRATLVQSTVPEQLESRDECKAPAAGTNSRSWLRFASSFNRLIIPSSSIAGPLTIRWTRTTCEAFSASLPPHRVSELKQANVGLPAKVPLLPSSILT